MYVEGGGPALDHNWFKKGGRPFIEFPPLGTCPRTVHRYPRPSTGGYVSGSVENQSRNRITLHVDPPGQCGEHYTTVMVTPSVVVRWRRVRHDCGVLVPDRRARGFRTDWRHTGCVCAVGGPTCAGALRRPWQLFVLLSLCFVFQKHTKTDLYWETRTDKIHYGPYGAPTKMKTKSERFVFFRIKRFLKAARCVVFVFPVNRVQNKNQTFSPLTPSKKQYRRIRRVRHAFVVIERNEENVQDFFTRSLRKNVPKIFVARTI